MKYYRDYPPESVFDLIDRHPTECFLVLAIILVFIVIMSLILWHGIMDYMTTVYPLTRHIERKDRLGEME